MENNKIFTEEQFEEDAHWIAEMARGYIVREFIEKWSKRVRFTENKEAKR